MAWAPSKVLSRRLRGPDGRLRRIAAVDDASTPDAVEIGEWLFRNGFLGGFPADFNF
jgi:hypothetical protein